MRLSSIRAEKCRSGSRNSPESGDARLFVSAKRGRVFLLGHNILFDYSFIKQAAINARLDFEKEAWDTLKIARKALPDLESRSLEALCGYYQIPREHAHRAMDDVLETLALFRKLEEGFSEDHQP